MKAQHDHGELAAVVSTGEELCAMIHRSLKSSTAVDLGEIPRPKQRMAYKSLANKTKKWFQWRSPGIDKLECRALSYASWHSTQPAWVAQDIVMKGFGAPPDPDSEYDPNE